MQSWVRNSYASPANYEAKSGPTFGGLTILRIVFKSLEGSWLAISLAYKVVKDELEEK